MNSFVPWDIRVTIDLFLGGVGVGAFLLALFAAAFGESYRLLRKTAAVISPVAVCMGLLFLIFELGRPERFITTLFRNNPASVMSWGVYLQAGFVILAVVYAVLVLQQKDEEGLGSLVKWLGGLFAVGVGLYHGFLLSSNASSALWNNGALPVMFFVSSVLSGIALVVLVNAVIPAHVTTAETAAETAAGGETGSAFNLNLVNIILLAVELLTVFAWMFTLARGNENMVFNLQYLLSNYGTQWWLGAVVVGLVLPLVFSIFGLQFAKKGQAGSTLTTVTAVLILIGGFVLKNVILAAGQVNYPLF